MYPGFRWTNCVKGFNMRLKFSWTAKKNGLNQIQTGQVIPLESHNLKLIPILCSGIWYNRIKLVNFTQVYKKPNCQIPLFYEKFISLLSLFLLFSITVLVKTMRAKSGRVIDSIENFDIVVWLIFPYRFQKIEWNVRRGSLLGQLTVRCMKPQIKRIKNFI
jgi:hypothetical protein